jgi:hypothetical protein
VADLFAAAGTTDVSPGERVSVKLARHLVARGLLEPAAAIVAPMTVERIDHVGIVVDDLTGATAFFDELGFELQGEGEVNSV